MRRFLLNLPVSLIVPGVVGIVLYEFLIVSGLHDDVSKFIAYLVGIGIALFLILLLVHLDDRKQSSTDTDAWIRQKRGTRTNPTVRAKGFLYAFQLTQEDLENIHKKLEEYILANTPANSTTDSNFYIIYKNNPHTIIQLKNLSEVFAIKNYGDEELQEFEMEVLYTPPPTTPPTVTPLLQISLFFRKSSSGSVRYFIIGEDSARVRDTEREITDITKVQIQKFAARFIGTCIIFLEIYLASIIFLILIFLLKNLKTLFASAWFDILAPTILVLAIASVLACMICFPQYNFYWGLYTYFLNKRHKVGEFILNNVAAIIIAILVGILAGLLANTVHL